MKNLFIALSALAIFAFTNPVHVTTKVVDTEASTITWKGYKVTGSHEGTVKVKEGVLKLDHGTLVGGSFSIDMTSLVCTDLEAGQGAEKLVGHLASPDFFNTAEHTTVKFEITKAVAYADNDYKVVGNLTIKEITKEIKFRANVADGKATAKITIDRTDFNVNYGSGSIFDGLADKTIYDEFDLDVTLVTK